MQVIPQGVDKVDRVVPGSCARVAREQHWNGQKRNYVAMK